MPGTNTIIAMRRSATALAAALFITGCAEEGGGATTTPEGQRAAEEGKTESVALDVKMVTAESLGTGWSEEDTGNPDRSILSGMCGGPDLVESSEWLDSVRYDRESTSVSHYVYEVEDALALTEEFSDAIRGCEGDSDELAEVRRAHPISLAVDDLPPTDTYRLLMDLIFGGESEQVWAVTPVGNDRLSLISVTVASAIGEVGDQRDDIFEVLENATSDAFDLSD